MMIALARQLNQSEEVVRSAGVAGLLHDLGKMLVPGEVLNKPGKLTDAEFAVVKRHPVAGHEFLLACDNIVDSGKSVIVIEHHQSVMAHADWIIDLGPGAGHDGGRIVFEGTPADLVAKRSTLTSEHLAAFVGNHRSQRRSK
jgi:hypothetical protein